MNEGWTIPENNNWSISDDARNSWDRKVPYYMRVRDHFETMIKTGALKTGRRLPPERVLAQEFSITRVTARRALLQLEAEGLIFREERRGWFVSPPRVRYDPTANTSFTESIAEQGRVAGTTVLATQKLPASPWQATQLGCAPGDPVFVIDRSRSVDGRVVLVEKIHVLAARCSSLLSFPLDQSMTDLMAREFGIIEHRAQIDMRPTALAMGPAKILGVAVGTPGLYLSRTIRDQFNTIVELDEEFWRHDAITISISGGARHDDTVNRSYIPVG
ncbi:UTRA domain-containing protein [Rhodobacteraceae bacterium R_SAG10]|jgi:DNA-binding GntR family transcriptional regulator|nr:UTRA domain-containing protein [Rhodobacteraceae bacterium R_SAG10]